MVSFQGKAQCNVNQKYDKIVSGYHSSIALSDNGNYLAWGQDIANDGATDQAGPPKALISSNYPSLTGTVLFTTIGGPGSGGKDQFIALTTTGLFAWGAVGSSTTGILSPTLKATTAFGLITTPTGGDAVTKLPSGVLTSQVTMMIGMYQALAIVANGNVWVLSQSDANIQGDGTSLASTTWHKVKTSAGVDLTNVTEIRGQLADGTTSAIMALTSTGLAYTWGTSTYLGNGTASAARNYATQMTLPAEFTSSNKPKMIGVTGGTNSSVVSNSYFVLSNSGALYALGDNHAKQLGDFTTTERTSWVNVKSAISTNFTNVNFISVQEHTGKMASAALITKTGVLYSWGDNDGNMIGRTSDGTSTGSAGTTYDPGNPVGFVVGVDKALFTEMGGHTLVYVKEGSSTFCYVGHRTNGSMGESTTSSGTVVSFDCTNTPAISLCGAVPIAADPTKSVISASPTTITANGTSTSTISIQLKNSSGANLTTTGGEVVVTTTAGTLGTVVDNNNGTYTVILTSSNTVTSTTIGFSINGTTATGANSTTSVNFVAVSVSPTITTTGTLGIFATCVGTASASQNISVTASGLTTDLSVTAPTGYELATTQAGTYSSSVIITAVSGTISATDIWVRLTGVSAGNYTGTLTCASTGATSQTISLTGTTGSIGGTVSGTTVVTSGTNTNTLTLSGYAGSIQWQSSTNNITFTDIPGATTATYTASNVAVTTYYKAVVTNGSCALANSTVATISFENGCYSFDIADFIMNGNATLMPTDVVRLTTATGNQNGSIWNKNKINLDYDFDISTSINLGNSNAGADGIAFVLQNQSVNAGSTGGGLGYQGITPSFAVEFDTYFNGGNDPGSGADHIAIVKNGNAANIAAHSEFAPPYEVEMEDGLWHDVRFVWTAATKNFKVYWNGSNTPLFNITQDLKANIFSNTSNVYFGLTAATGGAVNLQQVKVPTYCLVKQVAITPKAGYLNNSAATTFCAPAAVVLEASPSVSYLWYKDGVAMTDSTSRSIIVTTSGVYKVEAVDGRGITSTSPDQTVTVAPATVVGTITGGDVIVCSGTNNTTLTLVGSTGTIQWKSSTDNTTYTNITGATSATYTATNLNATTYYKAAVTSGSCSASLSAPASITVIPASVAGTISGATSVCTGTNNTVLTLVGSTGTIQWQSSIDNSTFTDITGATSATYTATDLTATNYYKAVVTSGACSAATTTAKTITVSPVSVTGTISGGNVSVCSGSDNSTTLTLTGYTGTIQWQSSSDNVTFANITGATNASYTANNVTSNTYYRAVVISGVCSSDMATAVLITSAPCIVANPDINATNLNTPVIGSINTNDITTTGTTYGTPVPSSSNPIGGTIQLNSDGTYTFTATNVGKYIYYITVCAAGQTTGCAVSTLEISVTDPNSTNNPPLAKNDYATLQVNTPVSVKVLSNDKVANSNTTLLPSSITVATAPTNGSAAVNTTTGVITFTPNTGFTGTDSLKYNVCDNASPSNCQVATVYLKVSSSSVPEYTTADDDFNTVNMNSSVTGNVLTNDVNSANNTLTVTSNSTPLSTQGTIVMNADGSYTFTPVANFYGPVDVTYTACTAGSVCATATLHILVSPVKPAAPKANGGTYTSKDPSNPATISSTVTNVPAGSKVIYCDVNGLSCANTAPTLPTTPGIYIWCVKSLDTITNLTSSPCVYDTITVLPYVKVVNATYVNGVATNPKNIAGLVTEISAGSIVKWCNVSGTSCSTIAPALPTLVGKSIWCVKAVDTASGLSSLVCKMDTVTILDPYTVLEITKLAKSVKLNPDGTILATFVMNATNKTDAVLDSVSIKDDLTRTFNVSSGIVVSSLDVYGGLVKNTGYDGIANIDLVTSASKVAAQKTDSVVLKVLIESTDVSGNLTNIATLAGKSKYGKLSVLSNDPLANPSDSTRRVATGFVVPKVDIVIAGGFSPNQDGMNDKWIIIRPYGTTIHVKVFNRWGNIVYENEDYNNDWDGRGQGNFIGNYVPDGTYFYMVEAIDANGNVQKFTKSLTIVR